MTFDQRLTTFMGLKISESDEIRFWSHVGFSEGSACWNWKSSRHRLGYGNFRIGGKKHGKTAIAHRFAYASFHGKEPCLQVLHSCDNPSCCNPSHLSEGTMNENMAQMSQRGRCRTPRPGNGHTKINEDDSLKIFQMCADGMSFREAAKRFNVTQPTARAHFKKHAYGI